VIGDVVNMHEKLKQASADIASYWKQSLSAALTSTEPECVDQVWNLGEHKGGAVSESVSEEGTS